jgi:hypothetical protein
VDICNHRFEKNPFLHSADPNPITFEAKFLGKADGLTSAILEQFRDFGLRHLGSIYQEYRPPQALLATVKGCPPRLGPVSGQLLGARG